MSHTLRFFHDFSSPYSYLAATQVEALAERTGAALVWHPMLLGAVFKSIGAPIVPFTTNTAVKQRYLMQDMDRWAAHWGVPFRFPTRFPMNTVKALRMLMALEGPEAAAFTLRVHRAYWAEDQDIADDAVLIALADELGLDGAALVAQTSDPDVKQRLFDATADAVARGVFGAPTFQIDDGEIYWGQDRMVLVEAALTQG
jgi:2-hydroxychromene-2-carboxylate isomerase